MKKTPLMLTLALACAITFSACGSPAAPASSGEASSGKASSSEASSSETSSSAASETSSASSSVSTADIDLAEAGVLEGNVYTNPVLGFTFSYPESWIALNAEDTLALQREKAIAVYGSDIQLDQSIKNGHMFYLSYAETQADEELVGNLLVQTAPAQALQGSTPTDYAEQLAAAFESGYTELGFDGVTVKSEPVETLTIDGHEVALSVGTVVINGEFNGQVFDNYQVSQAYSIFQAQDTVVVTMLSAFSDQQLADGVGCLRSVRFTA